MRLREGSLAGNVEILNYEMLPCSLRGEALDSVSLARHSWRGMIKLELVLVISALDV